MSHLCLHHSWSLCPQHFHCLKNVYNALVSHSFQHNAESDENSSPTNTRAVSQTSTNATRLVLGQENKMHFPKIAVVLKTHYQSCGFQAVLGTHLQWTVIGPSWPNCSFVLWTWPIKSMNPSPDFGTPCSGQSVNWNCLTVRDCPSWERKKIIVQPSKA